MTGSQPALRIALLGNPNCGKTALFNLLTGSRQKVANYAGVTVERKEGLFETADGQRIRVLDLPGAYSLNALSLDETITRDVVLGTKKDEERPDLLVCVTDATNLRLNLRLVVEAKRGPTDSACVEHGRRRKASWCGDRWRRARAGTAHARGADCGREAWWGRRTDQRDTEP